MAVLRFGKVSIFWSLALIFAAMIWKVVSLQVCECAGVLKALLGLDLVKGMNTYFVDGENHIAFLMQMDAPKSIE